MSDCLIQTNSYFATDNISKWELSGSHTLTKLNRALIRIFRMMLCFICLPDGCSEKLIFPEIASDCIRENPQGSHRRCRQLTIFWDGKNLSMQGGPNLFFCDHSWLTLLSTHLRKKQWNPLPCPLLCLVLSIIHIIFEFICHTHQMCSYRTFYPTPQANVSTLSLAKPRPT